MYSGGTLGALWGHSGGTLETLWGHSESEQNATKGKVTEAKVKVMISSCVEQSHPEDTGIRKKTIYHVSSEHNVHNYSS